MVVLELVSINKVGVRCLAIENPTFSKKIIRKALHPVGPPIVGLKSQPISTTFPALCGNLRGLSRLVRSPIESLSHRGCCVFHHFVLALISPPSILSQKRMFNAGVEYLNITL